MSNKLSADLGHLFILFQLEQMRTAADGDTYQATPPAAADQDTRNAARPAHSTPGRGDAQTGGGNGR